MQKVANRLFVAQAPKHVMQSTTTVCCGEEWGRISGLGVTTFCVWEGGVCNFQRVLLLRGSLCTLGTGDLVVICECRYLFKKPK